MADATAATLVPGLVHTLETEAPGVSLRLVPLTTRDPRRLLDDAAADLAVGYFPAVLADLGAREQAGEAVAFGHQAALRRRIRVRDATQGHPLARGALTLDRYCAARHLLVSFSGRPWGFIDEALAALDRQRRVVLTVNQFFTAGRVVAGSNLLTVLPRHFVGQTGMAGELVLRELPFEAPPVHVEALWHRRTQHSSAHQWLRQALVRASGLAFNS
jgi:DNA-binding transcriptional LysR family regulator